MSSRKAGSSRRKSAVELIPYDPAFDDAVGLIDASELQAIRYNEDVIKETVHLALFDRQCIGCGYLALGTVNDGILTVCCEFGVNSRDPWSIEAANALLDALKADYRRLAPAFGHFPSRLTVWAKEGSAVGDFAAAHGFLAGRRMTSFRNDLSRAKKEDSPLPDAWIKELDVTDPAVMKAYIAANGRGFGFPDSEKGLLFRVRHWKARVFAFVKDGQILSAVTVWPRKNRSFATEDIFCIPEYRRMHLTETLIRHVLTEGQEKGYASAGLCAFSHNTAAVKLYEKCGYEKEFDLIEYYYDQAAAG